jgi:hypothetical protein
LLLFNVISVQLLEHTLSVNSSWIWYFKSMLEQTDFKTPIRVWFGDRSNIRNSKCFWPIKGCCWLQSTWNSTSTDCVCWVSRFLAWTRSL